MKSVSGLLQGLLIVAAILLLVAVIVWVGLTSFIMFTVLKKAGILRVSAEIEEAGMDVSKHGGMAYPAN